MKLLLPDLICLWFIVTVLIESVENVEDACSVVGKLDETAVFVVLCNVVVCVVLVVTPVVVVVLGAGGKYSKQIKK